MQNIGIALRVHQNRLPEIILIIPRAKGLKMLTTLNLPMQRL